MISLISLSDPLSQIHPFLTLLCRNFTHFAAKYTFSHFPISITKSLFIDNNTTDMLQHTIIHYSSFPHLIILKLRHFCYPKHISISFFISHTKSSFLESNITNVIIQKTILATAFTTFNLHLSISYFHLFYKTHSSQNTHIYFSYISKLHISQSIHIQYPCPTKYLQIILIHITNTMFTIYTYFLSSPHILKYIKHSSKNLLLKTLSYERQKLIKSKALLMEGNITHI